MFLKLCLALLLATSIADNGSATTSFQHEDKNTNISEFKTGSPDMEVTNEMLRNRQILRSIYLAEEALKMMPKTAFYGHERVCYKHVGCFDRPGGKFDHFGRLPTSPKEVGTKFLLFTRRNKDKPEYLDYAPNATRGASARFDRPKDLVFVMHGYSGSANTTWVRDMRDALLEMADVNVILVDWSRGCKSPFYGKAVANAALVGRQISVLLQELISSHPSAVKASRVHLVGFSLGAQVAGFGGRYFFNATGTKIGRITALDAAGPLFQGYDHQISWKDASYVDAIHTTAGTNVLTGHLGVYLPFGHVDFYPNGGQSQPGCPHLDFYCHHQRAVKYFIESIRGKRRCLFKSQPCKGIDAFLRSQCNMTGLDGEMGYHSRSAAGRGQHFLRTNERSPFCRA